MSKMLSHLAVAGVMVVCLCGSLLAQGTTMTILGTVYDQSRAVLPGVSVTATEKETGLKRTAVTDDEGRYVMAQMKVGSYVVQAELPGFQAATRDVSVTLEGDSVANFTLGVGAAAQTEVTVTSEAPLVETTSSSVTNLVDHQQIRDLPLNGRSFTDLATLQTGVVVDYYSSRTQVGVEGTKISIAGTRLRQTLFQLDGTDMRNQKSASPGSLAGVQLGVDTVQEFSVITNVASAEYGAFTGGVVNAVTKSGTNNVHGTLFEFIRNSALDARNFFDRDPKNPLVRSNPPPFRRNQYGFTLGGPIRKDKIFFFASYEGLNDRLSTTDTASVPSLDARQGVIPNAAGRLTVSPVTKPVLDAYPLPNSVIRPDGTADYIFSAARVIDENYLVGKIDLQLNDKDSINFRYAFDDATRTRPVNMDVIFDNSGSRNQFILLEWKRLVSSKIINEARLSLNRSVNGQDFVENKPLPSLMHFNPLAFTFHGDPWRGTIAVPSLTTLGMGSTMAQEHVLNRFQYIDNVAYTTGAHSVKTGVNIHRLQLNNVSGGFVNGSYTFVNLSGFITGAAPRQYQGTLTGLVPRGMRQWLMGFYVQDDWRMRSNLTLNLGLRYEPFTLPVEVKGRLGTFRRASDTTITAGNPLFTKNPSHWNFAPRVGFAWDPKGDGKTSIRAGYGLFLELVQPLHYWSSIFNNPPHVLRFVLPFTTGGPVPFPDPRSAVPSDLSRLIVSPWGFSDDIEQGGVHQYQLSVQRQLSNDFAVQFAYMGSHAYNLGHMIDRNTAIPQKDAQGRYPFYPLGSVRRNAAFGQMRDFAWDGSSFYDSLGITVKKRFSHGNSFQVSYTLGKNMDDNSSAGVGEARSQPNGLNTFTDDITFDRALSDFDVRHRLSVNGSLDLPFGAGHPVGGNWTGIKQVLMGGWTLNSILTVSGGARANLLLPFNWSRSQQTADIPDRPSLIPGGNNNPILSDGRDPEKYFDGSQFILGPAGYFGNLGRNTLTLPGILAMDLSIQKNFNFTESKYLQFRGEMFNIANRVNFGSPSTGTFTSETQRSLTTGRITETTTTSRQIQFALKIYF